MLQARQSPVLGACGPVSDAVHPRKFAPLTSRRVRDSGTGAPPSAANAVSGTWSSTVRPQAARHANGVGVFLNLGGSDRYSAPDDRNFGVFWIALLSIALVGVIAASRLARSSTKPETVLKPAA